MKSRNKYLLIILLQFLIVLNLNAQNGINKIFFNLPLESSRDSIYSAIKTYGFKGIHSNRTITQNDRLIKTFYGYLDIKSLKETSIDSIKVQLSTGSTSVENEKYYQNLLIVWSYYHFSNVKTAKEFYQVKKNEIKKMISEKPYRFKNYFEDGNITIGFSDKFYEEEGDREISIEFKRGRQEHIVILGYQRNEGEKKLKKQLLPKKQLIFREIDIKNLFNFSNVEQIPVTRKCLEKNDKSAECFKNSIANYIGNNLDFEEFSLNPGTHRIPLSFIIDKEAKIINIKVFHSNAKLCEEIKNSINEIKISEPAINNGIKVDFRVEIPLNITIGN
jgi:hypothetical protein